MEKTQEGHIKIKAILKIATGWIVRTDVNDVFVQDLMHSEEWATCSNGG